MKRMILMPLLLSVIASCSNHNDQTESDLLSDPVSSGSDSEPDPDSEGSPDSEPEPGEAVITMDNHVEILANVFAIFSGKLYGDALLTAPDYSNPTYDDWPEIDPNTAELITQPADIVCSNGGTLSVVPETQGFFSDNLLTWNFDFDNCQDGIVMLDGQLSRAIYEAITLTSTGFLRDDQTRIIRYSGSLVGRSGSGRYWVTTNMDFSMDSSDSSLVIEDSTAGFFPDDLDLVDDFDLIGEFKVQADWTGGQSISVRIPDELTPGENAGKLELSAAPDNALVLDADTGDIDTVDITITANGTTTTVTRPWALWSDNLVFNSVSGY